MMMNPPHARAVSVALAAAAALAVGACSSDYALTLTVTDEVNASCNTSCVNSVAVEIFGESSGDFRCLDNRTVKSLRDNGLQGAIDLPVPQGRLLGASVTGFRGKSCDDLAVFDAIDVTRDHDLSLPVECTTSCSRVASMNVRTTDVVGVMQGKCDIGVATTVSAGTIRASHLGKVLTGYKGEASVFSGGAPVALSAGVATIPNAVGSVGAGRLCPAVVVAGPSGLPTSVACVRLLYRGACGGVNTEVAVYNGPALTPITDGYRTVAVFAEVDLADNLPDPIVGATVTLAPDAPPTATINYLKLEGGNVVKDPTLRATGPAGAFEVISPEPVTVIISRATAGGTVQYSRVVGGATFYTELSAFDVVGAQIITPGD